MLEAPRRVKPGLFVTATDTGVGKTVVTCALAAHLQRSGLKVGVCKPMATGCRRTREGLVNEDAEALAHFADCRQPLDVINPIRYAPAVAPAVAAEMTHTPPDFDALWRALSVLDDASDVLLVEGVGGLLVPIAGHDLTVLDLIQALGYPVVVVARAGLGTLNHSAMTVRLLREADCDVAGLVINGYQPQARDQDESMASNRQWLPRVTGVPILATAPQCAASAVEPQRGALPGEILDAVKVTDWQAVLRPPARA